MTHILLLDPHKEMILHNIPVYANSDVRKIEAFIRVLQGEHPDIERLILSMGTVRIMEPGEPIPVPMQAGKRTHGAGRGVDSID